MKLAAMAAKVTRSALLQMLKRSSRKFISSLRRIINCRAAKPSRRNSSAVWPRCDCRAGALASSVRVKTPRNEPGAEEGQ